MTFKIASLIFFLSLLLQNGFAQQSDTFHYFVDFNKDPVEREHAIYQVKVFKEKPADILWKKLTYGYFDGTLLETGTTLDSLGQVEQGEYQVYYQEGGLNESGHYDNGQKEGEWIEKYPGGKLLGKYNYHRDRMIGTNMSWYEGGHLQDSFALDKEGNGMGYGYYEDGVKKYEGKFKGGLKTGLWTYFYDLPRYHRSMEVEFEADSLLTNKCFTLNGDLQNICFYEKEAGFVGGDRAWVNYLVAELTNSSFAKYMKNRKIYEVIVRFVVMKDGSIGDIKIENGSNKKLDKIAEGIIRNSPAWEPAIQYNQKVNAYRRQPITFAVE